MRGTYIPLTDDQVVKRAKEHLDCWVIEYLLEPGKNGGTDPRATHCGTVWDRDPGPKTRTVATSDCIGLAAYCSGWDRRQPDFPFWGGWVNTDSLCAAAEDGSPWVIEYADPGPGRLIVYPSYRKLLGRDAATGRRVLGRRVPGHVGVCLDDKTAVHCHGPNLRGHAVHKAPLGLWEKRLECRYLRLVPSPERRRTLARGGS